MEPIKQKIARFPWKTKSGRTIPMGVGCAYLGSNAKDKTDDPIGNDIKLMEQTYEAGFRLYDTSADYGMSEDVVGGFLKTIDRDSIFLATKSPFPFRNKSKAAAFEEFKKIFYKSFERLGVDYIDLYQIHDTDDIYVCFDEVIPFLRDRQAEGIIGYIGMGTRDLLALELGVRTGALQSCLTYLEYSVLKTSAQPLFDTCERLGAGVLNAATLHYGVLKAEDPMQRTYDRTGGSILPSQLHVSEAAVVMQKLLKELGNVPIIAAALQISLFNAKIDVTLNGITRASNLASTLEAMDQVIYPEQWQAIFKAREALPYSNIQDWP